MEVEGMRDVVGSDDDHDEISNLVLSMLFLDTVSGSVRFFMLLDAPSW